jgi:hypothetical protein
MGLGSVEHNLFFGESSATGFGKEPTTLRKIFHRRHRTRTSPNPDQPTASYRQLFDSSAKVCREP